MTKPDDAVQAALDRAAKRAARQAVLDSAHPESQKLVNIDQADTQTPEHSAAPTRQATMTHASKIQHVVHE